MVGGAYGPSAHVEKRLQRCDAPGWLLMTFDAVVIASCRAVDRFIRPIRATIAVYVRQGGCARAPAYFDYNAGLARIDR
jgi:hypothetical protein